ncbi:hypothetical protein [Thermomonospora amylolytica]|uniref:hypothetical protein n=1 Tax=Thermomonospora amylolytica TaxID=1411117 RepID=UPI001F1577E4|nr:hypothetical protein [Thermomonospora amylolytica]
MPHRDATRRRRRAGQALGLTPGRTAPAGSVPAEPTAVRGTIVDASPHVLVLDTGGEPIRLPLTPTTSIWYGGRSGLHALVPGREAIVRPSADGPGVERVWVDITRVTGTILDRSQRAVEVDQGPHRGSAEVAIPDRVLHRILVRHPRLEPGELMDVICVRSPDGPRAVRPGTSQPAQRITPAAVDAPSPTTVQGTATWFRSDPDAGAARGAAYPAVDPEGHAGGCADAPPGCAPLPYLSQGSELIVHNECTGRATAVPVVECGCVAARYCDRCVECGTSPRGRVVELTPEAFVDLGGDLDAGCFNARLDLTATAVRSRPEGT